MVFKRRSILLFACAGLCFAYAQTHSQIVLGSPVSERAILTSELLHFIEEVRVSDGIPGLTVSVVGPDGQTELAALGGRTEDGEAMTVDTTFFMASCSKAFAASALGILMEDYATGKNSTALPPVVKMFDWKTKVTDILPEVEFMDEWTNAKMNLQDMLAHVSGLPSHDYSYGPMDSTRDIVARMHFLRPTFELRQQFSYTNLMYILTDYIITKYTGSFQSFVKERIFDPLNMSSTTYYLSEALKNGNMTQSWTKDGRRIPLWYTDDVGTLKAGPGGVISSVRDMVKWVKVQLNSGVDPETGKTIIPRPSFDQITTAHSLMAGKSSAPGQSLPGYGAGWSRFSYYGREILSHSGGIPGSSTNTMFLPGDGIGVVVLANADEKHTAIISNITMKIVDTILNITVNDSELEHLFRKEEEIIIKDPLGPRSVADLSDFAGTYHNPGYGAFTLCEPQSDSHYCTAVLSDFAAVDAQSSHDTPRTSQLVAAWPRVPSSHVRMDEQDGDSFAVRMTALFPQGYGKNTTAFETYETGASAARAHFVRDESGAIVGFGTFGILGVPSPRERGDGSIEDRADVWFTRV